MKKQALFLSLVFVLAVSVLTTNVAYAQEPECRDASGAVIPCPPTEEPSTGGGGSNPNPPSVVTATPSPTLTPVPTSTPLPISDKPTENPTKNAPSEVTPTPTTEPVITSSGNDGATEGENDWEDVCTFDLCLGLTVACYWDGGTPEIVEDGSGNTGVHCTIPDAEDGAANPPSWGPVIITGLFVVLMVMLLPAVQKVREAAARSGQTREHVLLNKDDEPQEAKKIFLGGLSAKPDEPSEAKSKPKPPPPPPPPPPSGGGRGHKDWIDIQSFSSDPTQSSTDEEGIGKEDIIKREDKDKG